MENWNTINRDGTLSLQQGWKMKFGRRRDHIDQIKEMLEDEPVSDDVAELEPPAPCTESVLTKEYPVSALQVLRCPPGPCTHVPKAENGCCHSDAQNRIRRRQRDWSCDSYLSGGHVVSDNGQIRRKETVRYLATADT
ncbi:hypothetical protein HNY73_019858 [Argiope bruennichi]|uniref:Uncharacterized protein n=1 Tax=Argiope bruennichi TaxID=94029 RepID=A0A8T0E4X8_ARGBR|nr:hypothetical protein HNY73_019858 [Argiope bruennichi]